MLISPTPTQIRSKRSTTSCWIIEELLDGLYTIQNYASGSYLSYTGAVTGLDPTSAQLCGHGDPFLWSIIPNANGKNKFNIIEPQSGLAVTSWPGIQSAIISLTTPVWFFSSFVAITLQEFDHSVKQQIFSFTTYARSLTTNQGLDVT
ncbi:hypothetical protein B0H19DRAFT_1067972 [Mycena capillaripes]|nr:hypothetical protein B0H19DRAFT_1067972 [Mycena capillaripes]